MPTLQKQVLFTGQQRGYYLYRIPSLIVSKKNTVLAFCEARRHTGADDDEIDIAMRRSFDNGKTWDEQHIIVSDGIRTCSNPCSVVDMATGTILLLFCKDNQQVFLTKSYDDGQTWTEPKEITNISNNVCNMQFETLYLKGQRYEEALKDRITDIIDIYEMKNPPDYNPNCASCKFVTSLKKEKYI